MVAPPSETMSAILSVIKANIFSGFPRATPNELKFLIKPWIASGLNFNAANRVAASPNAVKLALGPAFMMVCNPVAKPLNPVIEDNRLSSS